MNILITTGIFPPDIGGPATYVPRMAQALIRYGHQVRIVATSEPEHLSEDDGIYPFPVIRLNRHLRLERRIAQNVASIVRHGQKADLIYGNGMHLETAIAKRILRKPLATKIVGDEAWERSIRKKWTQDTLDLFQTRPQKRPAQIQKRLRNWYIRQSDRVIVPSQYLKGIVVGWGVPEDRCAVVYNAVRFPDNVESISAPLKTPLKLVTVGRLVPWKHVDQLIKCLMHLDTAGLVVVGDGPERQSLEESVRAMHLTQRVFFAGQRSQSETYALMSACDIFVLNSSYEGLPHVVLEAMRLGLPVVATAAGGTPEVVRDGETGLLVTPGDNEGLCEAIRRLSANGHLRQSFQQNARAVLTHFEPDTMITETERNLRETLLAGAGI